MVVWFFVQKTGAGSLRGCVIAMLSAAILAMVQLPAFGYVLEGPHLLWLMTHNSGKANTLVVHQTLMVYDSTLPGAIEEISETLSYRFSDAFRSDSHSEKMNRIHVDTRDDTLTVYDEKVSLDDHHLFDRYKDLLLFRSRVLLQERLATLGVNVGLTSLGRFEQAPVVILGAEYPDESLPQVWIDKQTFRPIRWLIPQTDANENTALFEIRYLQWQQFDGLWYPMQIQCFQDRQLIREMRVQTLAANEAISDDLFDIGYLRARYALQEAPGQDLPVLVPQDDIPEGN